MYLLNETWSKNSNPLVVFEPRNPWKCGRDASQYTIEGPKQLCTNVRDKRFLHDDTFHFFQTWWRADLSLYLSISQVFRKENVCRSFASFPPAVVGTLFALYIKANQEIRCLFGGNQDFSRLINCNKTFSLYTFYA